MKIELAVENKELAAGNLQLTERINQLETSQDQPNRDAIVSQHNIKILFCSIM